MTKAKASLIGHLDPDSSAALHRKNKKRDPALPKRALSAYMYFSKCNRDVVKAEDETLTFTDIGRELGKKWKLLSDEDKKVYLDMAAEDKVRFESDKELYDANLAVKKIAEDERQRKLAAEAALRNAEQARQQQAYQQQQQQMYYASQQQQQQNPNGPYANGNPYGQPSSAAAAAAAAAAAQGIPGAYYGVPQNPNQMAAYYNGFPPNHPNPGASPATQSYASMQPMDNMQYMSHSPMAGSLQQQEHQQQQLQQQQLQQQQHQQHQQPPAYGQQQQYWQSDYQGQEGSADPQQYAPNEVYSGGQVNNKS